MFWQNPIQHSVDFYRSDNLPFWAEQYIRKIPKDVNCLVSMGSSGTAISSAILCKIGREMSHISVAKENESRYTGDYSGSVFFPEHRLGLGNTRVIVVDDFIETGKTIEKILDFCENQEMIVEKIIVGGIVYDYSSERIKPVIDLNHERLVEKIREKKVWLVSKRRHLKIYL